MKFQNLEIYFLHELTTIRSWPLRIFHTVLWLVAECNIIIWKWTNGRIMWCRFEPRLGMSPVILIHPKLGYLTYQGYRPKPILKNGLHQHFGFSRLFISPTLRLIQNVSCDKTPLRSTIPQIVNWWSDAYQNELVGKSIRPSGEGKSCKGGWKKVRILSDWARHRIVVWGEGGRRTGKLYQTSLFPHTHSNTPLHSRTLKYDLSGFTRFHGSRARK